MRQATVSELKDRLSLYLRLVKAGETIEITERSVPIALLTRRTARADRPRELSRLIRDGLITDAQRQPDLASLQRPAVRCTADVVEALVEARGER
jgi:prevent-host-death family protein